VYKQSVIRSSLISSGKISVYFTPFAMSLIAQVISSVAAEIFKKITYAHTCARAYKHTHTHKRKRRGERERGYKDKGVTKRAIVSKIQQNMKFLFSINYLISKITCIK